MTAPARQNIRFIQATYDEVQAELLADKSPAEVAGYLGESVGNVMGVWADLRNAGKVEAKNFTQQVGPRAVPAPPRHETNPALAQRIADSTDLLVKAATIDDKRIQAALGRARKAMVDLAGLIETHESKSAARSRIARLEAELRIARAELTAKPASAAANGGGTAKPKSGMSDAKQAALTKAREASQVPADCPACGLTCKGPAGVASHQRGPNCPGTKA